MHAVLLAIASLSGAPDLLLAEGGRPVSSIVLPSEPTATEQFAAEELRDHLRRVTGAELAITSQPTSPGLWVGRTAKGLAAQPDLAEPESFSIGDDDGDVVIAGGGDRGTLYAVYDFLEREVGCRWLAPGEEWTVVPDLPRLAVTVTPRREQPAMRYRFLRQIRPGSELGTWVHDCLIWAVRQRVNIGSGWPPAEIDAELLKRGGVRGWMQPHDMIPNVLPPDKYFDEHPEWYGLVRGQRRNLGRNTQLCTTNPEVIERVVAGLRKTLDACPTTELIGMGQADGTAFCECDRCRALDAGDIWPSRDNLPVITERWLSFVNAVARQLAVTHPGKRVFTLAYHQTFRPPAAAAIQPEPNVIIQVVNSRPNYLCFVHRLDRPDCPGHERFRAGFEQWSDETPAGLMVYQYIPHSTWCNMPYVGVHKFIDDVRWLRDHGAVGYEGQSSTALWGVYGISLYAMMKACWNPEVDADELVADYCRHAYGAAAEPMMAFYRTMEDGLAQADHITDGVWSAMTPAIMASARRHLDGAHAAAGDEAVAARLHVIEAGFHYGELGAAAWRTAEAALAAGDATALQQAVELAESACSYLDEPANRGNQYAAAPGKLRSVYLKRWRESLERLKP